MDKTVSYLACRCAEHFGIGIDDLYGNSHLKKNVEARHILWYILHCDYGVSVPYIAKEFNRSKRNVFISISKIRYGIRMQKYYLKHYLELKNI